MIINWLKAPVRRPADDAEADPLIDEYELSDICQFIELLQDFRYSQTFLYAHIVFKYPKFKKFRDYPTLLEHMFDMEKHKMGSKRTQNILNFSFREDSPFTQRVLELARGGMDIYGIIHETKYNRPVEMMRLFLIKHKCYHLNRQKAKDSSAVKSTNVDTSAAIVEATAPIPFESKYAQADPKYLAQAEKVFPPGSDKRRRLLELASNREMPITHICKELGYSNRHVVSNLLKIYGVSSTNT